MVIEQCFKYQIVPIEKVADSLRQNVALQGNIPHPKFVGIDLLGRLSYGDRYTYRCLEFPAGSVLPSVVGGKSTHCYIPENYDIHSHFGLHCEPMPIDTSNVNSNNNDVSVMLSFRTLEGGLKTQFWKLESSFTSAYETTVLTFLFSLDGACVSRSFNNAIWTLGILPQGNAARLDVRNQSGVSSFNLEVPWEVERKREFGSFDFWIENEQHPETFVTAPKRLYVQYQKPNSPDGIWLDIFEFGTAGIVLVHRSSLMLYDFALGVHTPPTFNNNVIETIN